MIKALGAPSLSEWLQLKITRIKSNEPKLVTFLILAYLFVVVLSPQLFYTHTVPLEYDEGVGVMFGTLAALGHTPYTETFVGIPPLALLTIQLGVILFGDSLTVRYPMILYSLMGIITLFWL